MLLDPSFPMNIAPPQYVEFFVHKFVSATQQAHLLFIHHSLLHTIESVIWYGQDVH